jgi:hypothetical protein
LLTVMPVPLSDSVVVALLVKFVPVTVTEIVLP